MIARAGVEVMEEGGARFRAESVPRLQMRADIEAQVFAASRRLAAERDGGARRPPSFTAIGIGCTILFWVAVAPAAFPNGFGVLAALPVLIFLAFCMGVRIAALGRLVAGDRRDEACEHGQPDIWPRYTVIAPVHDEAEGAARLIEALVSLDYPTDRLEIFVVGEAADRITLKACRRAAAPFRHVAVLATPDGRPTTKGRASNYALAFAQGQFVVVYDAEDRPAPDQLKMAASAFLRAPSDVACLQARLMIANRRESYTSRMMHAEYAAHFHGFLPTLARLHWRFPLSGSSNHFRMDVLRAVGGWDAWNVTEDADLGFRLACAGHRAELLHSTTEEEAPVRLADWRRQRTRWIKGFLQTLAVYGRRPRQFVKRTGTSGLAGMAVGIAGVAVPALLFPPAMAAPLLGAAWRGAFDAQAFAAAYGVALLGLVVGMATLASGPRRASWRTRFVAACGAPVYWLLMVFAAYCALYDLVFRPHAWDKTPHGAAARRLI